MPAWPAPGARLVTVGRFLPPTRADDVLLSFASHGPWPLTIAVLTDARDPIPFDVRRAWLESRAPHAVIRNVAVSTGRPAPGAATTTASGPWDTPTAGDDGTTLGTVVGDAIQQAVAGTDALVGLWPDALAVARRLGWPCVPVEVPWSWAAPAPACAGWAPEAPSPGARGEGVRRVVVMGPESTGKTTLARDLARHFETPWVSEYLRVWLDAKGSACEPGDLPAVVAGHRASEEALAHHANRVLFCDTDPLMTAVYSRFYYGTLPAWLDEAASARRAALYVLLDCDVPWVPDPHRDMPHRRDEIRDICVEELERRGLPWRLVRGSWTERFDMARHAVEQLLLK